MDRVRGFPAAMEPFSADGVYGNFMGSDGEERVRHAYGEEKWSGWLSSSGSGIQAASAG
jgi:hypothetical protein